MQIYDRNGWERRKRGRRKEVEGAEEEWVERWKFAGFRGGEGREDFINVRGG